MMKCYSDADRLKAAKILKRDALWTERILEMGERHYRADDECIGEFLARAAAAGEADARALILDEGILETLTY